MYIPRHFSHEDRDIALRLVSENAFGLLMTPVDTQDGTPELTHLPMLYIEEEGEGRIIGHVAKANPHWKSFDGKTPAIAVFTGPHAYISPNWYESEAMVPTWNYASVHMHGCPTVVADDACAEAILERLVGVFESEKTGNWSMDLLPDGHLSRQLKGIVAFEMPVSQMETKVKMSQNRSANDIQGVIDALTKSKNQDDQATAQLMAEINTH